MTIIESRGVELTNILKDKGDVIDLKVLYIENVNFNEHGLKKLIHTAKKMKSLQEFALVNMPGVKDELQLIETAFMHHKTLERLDLRDNNLPHYDWLVAILASNRKIKSINVRGSEMSVDNHGYLWLGLRENISTVEVEY